MKWAFVDYENVHSLGELELSEYERVFVFYGSRDKKLTLGDLPDHQFCRLEVIRVAGTGPNLLDFHLAFHLGRFHEIADPEVEFQILSRDSGFEGLIRHVGRLQRSCRQIKPPTAPPWSAPRGNGLSREAAEVVDKLRQVNGNARPRKRASLGNWIEAAFRGSDAPFPPDRIL